MTGSHILSHGLRAALLVLSGSALIAVPLLLGLDAAPIVTGVLVGSPAIALGLAGTEPGGRGSLPMSTQAAWDRGLGLGLLLAGGIFGLFGELDAMALFAVAGVTGLIMTSVTRYSTGTV